jgi:hypothetical protein
MCLLLKFIHKLHTSSSSSWAKWIHNFVYRGGKYLGDKITTCSSSWRYMMTLIQMYMNLTVVKVGNGRDTCFWLDSWIGRKPLSDQYPALFSHVQKLNIFVTDSFIKTGWELRFRHLTSQRAEVELLELLDCLGNIELTGAQDERSLRFGPSKKFPLKGVLCQGNSKIWIFWAPKKCKIFAWLALHNRLGTRERLARRGIISNDNFPFGCHSQEGLSHMLFHCKHTSFLWQIINVHLMQGEMYVQRLITNANHMQPSQQQEWATLSIAIAWNIWLMRNHKVFDNVEY